MDYQRIYNEIVSFRKDNFAEGYTEIHHIVPRSLGGSDEDSNLVKLTAREHFICHLLLTKVYKDKFSRAKMIRAFMMMLGCSSRRQNRYISSRKYESLKKEYSKIRSDSMMGSGNISFGTKWVTCLDTGNSSKIPKDAILPEGYVLGRNKKTKICPRCNQSHILGTKYCSKDCANVACGDNVRERNKDNPQRYKNGYKVMVNGVVFDSISQAADFHEIGHETARRRFISNNFVEWVIL